MLSRDQYARAKALFEAAVELTPAERSAYLDKACDDAALRVEVESLLALSDADRTALSIAEAPPGLLAPDQVGPYRIVEILGEGGMGSVYLSEQVEPVRRRVALKVIKRGMDSREVIRRFEAERQALANLDHHNIAKVLDVGTTDDGRPYFAMEYVDGVRITEHCDDNSLSIGERLRLFISVCEAVQHAHQKGIIHRDLKPGNILIATADGNAVAKVIDFGIAKAVSPPGEDATFFTQRGQFVGTPAYTSPEQADTSSRDIDTRSDIYSLGVLLYELLTGALPFEREKLQRAGQAEMARIIRELEPPKPSTRLGTQSGTASEATTIASRNRRTDPRSLCRLVRGDLDWITMKCLEKERDRRYPTAQDLAEDIRRHLSNLPIIAGPPSVLYRARKAIRRHRGLILATTIVALALIGGATLATIYAISENRARAEATRQAGIADEIRRLIERALTLPPPEVLLSDTGAAPPPVLQGQRKTESIVAGIDRFLLIGSMGERYVPRWNPTEANVLKRILSKTATALDTESISPETAARMHIVIGKAYSEVGAPDEARRHLDEGRQRTLATVGAHHEWYADVLDYIGLLSIRERKPEGVAAMLDESLALRAELFGPSHPSVADTWLLMGALHARQKDVVRATECLEQALSIFRQAYGKQCIPVAECYHNLAFVAHNAGDQAGTESYFRKSFEILNEAAGPLDSKTAAVRLNLASLLTSAGRLEESLALIEEETNTVRRSRGEGPDLALSLNNQGMQLMESGDLTAAEPIFRECEAIVARTAPGHDVETTIFNNLGFVLRRQERWKEAVPYLRKAVEGYGRTHGPMDRLTITKLHLLADTLERGGERDEAEVVYRESLRRARIALAVADWERTVLANKAGWFLLAQGHSEDAAAIFAEYLSARREMGDLKPNELANEVMNLGLMQYRAGAFKDAERTYREAVDLRRQMVSSDPAGPASPLGVLGMTLINQGRAKEAEPLLREAVEIRRRELAKDDYRIAVVEAALGSCLVESGDFDGAEALLPAAVAILENQEPNSVKDALEFAEIRLKRLHEVRGRP